MTTAMLFAWQSVKGIAHYIQEKFKIPIFIVGFGSTGGVLYSARVQPNVFKVI